MSAPSRIDLTTGNVSGHLARLSVPMIWGILSIVSMQLADVYYISQLGHTELAAISFTFPVSMVVFNLVMGLSIATSSITARLIGQNDFDGMKHFIAHAIMIACGTGVLLALIGTAVLNPVFRELGAGPEHMPFIRAFMLISLWGYMFITVPLVGNSAIRASGDAFTPSLIMVGAAVFNIILSYGLVFGHFGLPAMGVAGAATANVTANILAAIAGFYVLIIRKHLLDQTCLSFKNLGANARRLLMIAVPIGLTNLIQPLVAAFITALLASEGASAVAAYGIITRVEAMAAVILMALSVGMSPIIGQCFGARRFDRIEETLNVAIRFAVVWSLLVGIILILCGAPLARAFTTDADTIHITALYFMIMGGTTAISNLAMGWGSAWNAMGRPQMSVILMVGRSVVGVVLFGWLGHMAGGINGLFWGLAIGNLTIGIILHYYSASRFAALKRAQITA